MQDDERTIAEKSFGKIESSQKQREKQLAKYCSDASHDEHYPEETRIKANELFAEWCRFQTLSPTEQQTKAKESQALIDRMETFRSETQ